MSEKRQRQTFTSPKGIFIYPKLNKPDTKFKAEGEYSVKLKVSGDEAQPFIEDYEKRFAAQWEAAKAELEEKLKEAKTGAEKAKLKKALGELKESGKPYAPAYDDEGNETEDFIIKFTMKASYTDKKTKQVKHLKPAVFDAAGKLLKNPPEIWGGTIGYVAGEFNPWLNAKNEVGVSLRLGAVQIIELSSGGGGRSAEGYGFGSHEGGFEGDDSEAPASDTPEGEGQEGGDEAPDHDEF